MRHYIGVAASLLMAFLVMCAAAEALGLPLLTGDPFVHLIDADPGAAAAIGVGFLVVDMALPVPSSVVMIMHGAVFGHDAAIVKQRDG